MMRPLFLDVEALVSADRVRAAWDAPEPGSDPAREAFARALDRDAVALLDAVCREGGVTHVVVASKWRLLWSTLEIAEMLARAGFSACRKFSSIRVKHDWRATAGVGGWLDEWADEVDSFAAIVSDEDDLDLAGSVRGEGGKLDAVAAARVVRVLTGAAATS